MRNQDPSPMHDSTRVVVVEALAFAQRLADQVDERLLSHFGRIRDVTIKVDGTLVTEADLESDRLVSDAIQRQYPDHDIISEELDTIYEGAPWCWIVDPLDGTTNFAQGVPVWAVSIALAHNGWPVLGLIDLPTLGLRYHATQGGGAFENGRPVSVMPDVDWRDSARLENQLFTVCSRTFQHFTADLPLKPRILGAAAYNFCLAASGVSLASMDATPKVWDMAAGWLLVREAGGVVVQLDGEPIFPLVADRDYRGLYHPQLSAPSEVVANELIERLERRPT